MGEAWPGGPNTVSAPTRSGLVRGGDKLGNGGFLAVRWDDRANNLRFHGGIDYVATPGENIYSPITGEVIRIKNPGHDLNGILIRAQNGYTASVYYINVDQSIIGRIAYSHAPVEAGKTLIGTAQDIRAAYGPHITNHVHVTLEDPQGNRISPADKSLITK